MEIKLSQSELISIIKKHLEAQNISSGDVILQVAGSKIQATVLDAEGKPPKSSHMHINGANIKTDGFSRWQEPYQGQRVFTKEQQATGGNPKGGYKFNLNKEDVTEQDNPLGFTIDNLFQKTLSSLSKHATPEQLELRAKELKNGQGLDLNKMTDFIMKQFEDKDKK